VAHGVDAIVEAVKSPGFKPPLDRSPPQSHPQQLPAIDDSVLSSRQLSELNIHRDTLLPASLSQAT
jgi:hypothetical protein